MKKALKITKEQLKDIFGKDWKFFEEKILPSCFCVSCGGGVAIFDWEPELNDLNDVVLCGRCAKCGGGVNRYLETGENGEYEERIEEIKKQLGKIEIKL